MTPFKNKIYLVLLLLASLIAAYAIASWPKNIVEQEQVKKWVIGGYTEQFCGVLYPRISSCVTFNPSGCREIASNVIVNCIENGEDIPAKATQKDAKKIYDSYSYCFEENIHSRIIKDYLIQSPQCIDMIQG